MKGDHQGYLTIPNTPLPMPHCGFKFVKKTNVKVVSNMSRYAIFEVFVKLAVVITLVSYIVMNLVLTN